MSKKLSKEEINSLLAKAEFFDMRDCENLEHNCLEDCIEDYVDLYYPKYKPGDIVIDKVTLLCRMEPDKEDTAPLDSYLEWLDEKFGNPDGDYTVPTEGMKAACKTFVKAVIDEYLVWECEQIGTIQVKIIWPSDDTYPIQFEILGGN